MSSVIETVVQQHAEEAAFLWLLRSQAVSQPHYHLSDLAGLDERIEAHLDGLRIAGERGWEICKAEMAWEEPGEVFTGVLLACESGDPLRVEEVLAIGDQSPELGRGVISALGWIPYPQAQPYIHALFESENPIRRRIGIGAGAVHRQNLGAALDEALRAPEPEVRSRALKAVGELGRTDTLSDCLSNLDSEDERCRFWAAWSATLLGSTTAIPVLWAIMSQSGTYAEPAAGIALRRLPLSNAHGWIRDLAQRPEHQRLAIHGAAVAGDPALVPWLLRWMEVPELARLAGESLTTITGVDLVDEKLEGEGPKGFDAGPTEEPEDDNVAMDPDDDLPWPEPQLIARWWSQNQSRFTPGTRHLMGQPITPPALAEVLRTGMQRQRAAAALELALLQPAQPLFEVRARGDVQLRLLGMK